ncbi:MAG: enoyl-CoA hydratase/isomerase family protein [Acidobacteriota bacterium]|jgi:enoyl-CoA hydratase
MSEMPVVTVEDRQGVRWVTINRPDKLNALNRQVLAALGEAMAAAVEAREVRVVVITGAGEKAFVAGADIAEFEGLSTAQAQQLARRGQRLYDTIERCPKPVIAAVNGFALGGGCELAMACHLRVASSTARFGQPEVKLGLIPGYGGTQRLPRLVGRGRALQLLLTGGMIDAATALAWGLVNRVVEPAQLAETVQALASEILAVSPGAVRRCLDAVAAGLDSPLEKALEVEAALFGLCFGSPDAREGTEAFLAKRPPQFQPE